ncbi:MAG: ABC transporter permease [Candidatus Diapherotrites archaeon]|nr:ABC transporter permease [Candidatus Diapherotrites archaeon]
MSAIYVFWLRQLKRYYRSKARMIGALGQPVLFLLALGFGFGPVFEKAGAGNYLEFLTPGIIAMSILFTATFSGIEVIWDKQFGFLKETLVAPVSRLEIMLGRTLGGATVASIQGIIVLIIASLAGFTIQNWSMLPLAFVFMFLIAVLFTALGTALASVLDDMQGFQLIINFLIMPLFFLSGALFPLDTAPGILGTLASLNPLSYGVDGLRYALIGVSHLGVFTDLAILGTVTLIFLGIGSYLFSKIQI